jgi:hypothetical protein
MINSQTSQDLRQQCIGNFFDLLTSEQRQTDPRFERLENQFQELERKFQEQERQLSWLVSKANQCDYVYGRNQELESMDNPYSLDGDANCNY